MALIALDEYVAADTVANYKSGLAGQVAEETETPGSFAEESSGAYREGQFCRYLFHREGRCREANVDCFNSIFSSKEKGCSLAKQYEEYEKTRNTTRYLARQIRKARDSGKDVDVSQLTYYVGLARERLNEWKLPNARIYNKIIIEKLNSI